MCQLSPEHVGGGDAGREAAWADDFQPPWKLSDENRAWQPVVAVRKRIESAFAYHSLIESRDVFNKKSLPDTGAPRSGE